MQTKHEMSPFFCPLCDSGFAPSELGLHLNSQRQVDSRRAGPTWTGRGRDRLTAEVAPGAVRAAGVGRYRSHLGHRRPPLRDPLLQLLQHRHVTCGTARRSRTRQQVGTTKQNRTCQQVGTKRQSRTRQQFGTTRQSRICQQVGIKRQSRICQVHTAEQDTSAGPPTRQSMTRQQVSTARRSRTRQQFGTTRQSRISGQVGVTMGEVRTD